jgi:uncharacterized delta-60 repeat protein
MRRHRALGSARSCAAIIIGVLVILSSATPAAVAVPGDVDTTFGHDGLLVLDGLTYPFVGAVDFAFQKNGRIVYASTASSRSGSFFTVTRLRSDGRPDAGFGNGGTVKILFRDPDGEVCTEGLRRYQGEQPFAGALTMTHDGGIVVAGHGCGKEIALAKLRHDGSLDTTFGNDGVVRTPVRGFGGVVDILPASGGRLVVVGGSSGGLVVARYRPNGALDTTFAHDGVRVLALPEETVTEAAALQSDGAVVFAGFSYGANIEPVVGRVGPKGGHLDAGFGTDGTVFLTGLQPTTFTDVALQKDGSIVAVGSDYGPIIVARFSYTGVVESVRTPDLGTRARGIGVAISPSGEIFAAGAIGDLGRTGFVAAAFGPRGWPDRSFGRKGRIFVAAPLSRCCKATVVLDSEGRIVVDDGYAFLRLLGA